MPTHPSVVYDTAQKTWSAPDYPHWDFVNRSLGAAFLANMRSVDADKVLEYHYDTGIAKTAAEIHREAITVALNLRRLGVQKGDIIVLYSMNNAKTTALIMGSFLVGAIVNFFETKFSKEHIDYALQLLTPTMILYEEAYAPNVADSLQRCPPLTSLKYNLSIDGTAASPNVDSELWRPVEPAQIAQFQPVPIADPQLETAALAFTSGSTGPPKVVQLTHALMLHGLATWCAHTNSDPLPPDLVVFSFSPLRWVSQVEMMLLSVLAGARRVCASGLPDGAYGRDIIRQCGINFFFAVPSIFLSILRALDADDVTALSSLRTVQLGGERVSPALQAMSSRLVTNGQVYTCYGMTEVCGCITNDAVINGGQLTPGMQVRILDDDLRPLGPNEPGQLCIRAPVPFKGYYKVDYQKDHFEDGFFLNGDYGYMDDENNLHVDGRYTDLVRAKDATLVPANIEFVISELPEVSAAHLVGCRNSANSSDEIGILFVLLENQAIADDMMLQKIRQVLEAKLTAVECANIGDIHFVTKLPLTSSGKVDRTLLRSQASQM